MEELDLGLDIDVNGTSWSVNNFLKNTLPHYIKGAGLRLNDLSAPTFSGMPLARSALNSQEKKLEKAWERVEQYEKKVVTVYQTLMLCTDTATQPYKTILVKKYIDNQPDWKVANLVKYSDRQFGLKKKLALCDFAELLEAQKVKNSTLDIPNLLVYKQSGFSSTAD